MCYSAMVKEEFRSYVRATGAEIDIDQFTDIFWNVAQGEKITIPRAVERWFDKPATAGERRIHEYILLRHAAHASAWTRELFAQKKRLADAERKLVTKSTKTAENDKRIATNKIEQLMTKLSALGDPKRRLQDGRVFPMNYAPIVMDDGGRRVVRLARYHCRLAGKSASVDTDFSGLYNARRDNMEKYWRSAFGTNHALMLAESFYENVQRDGRNAVLHFAPRPAETMLVACIYSVWKDPGDGTELLSFAAITDEPPPEVAATGHDRMIINIRPENVDAWLSPRERTDAQLQAILSDRHTPYYEHEVLAA